MTDDQFKDRLMEILSSFMVKAEAAQAECRIELAGLMEQARGASISKDAMELFYKALLDVSQPNENPLMS